MSDSSTTQGSDKSSGKGRPTPKRKDAEAAAKARAASGGAANLMTAKQRRKAMRAGDERMIPERFRGEQMTFLRDWVDHKLRPVELVLPLLLGAIFLSITKVPLLVTSAVFIQTATFLAIFVDLFRIWRGSVREFSARYPDKPTQGVALYAVSRAMQMRFMRQPMVTVGRAMPLPKRYIWSGESHRWIGLNS